MLNNKVAIITGSRRGLGEETAYLLAEKGCNIVVNDKVDEEKVNTVVKNIKERYKVDSIGVFADVSTENGARLVVDECLKHFGKIDILVNNASIVYDMDLEERTLDIFNETILNNISSVYIMSKLAGENMLKNKSGKIINISSTNAMNAFFPTSIDYDCSKAAIISLTKNFALAYAPYINVNSVAPGWINTEMNEDLEEELIEEENNKIFLHRFATKREVANLISYLASDEANYINGEVIKIDGGYQ